MFFKQNHIITISQDHEITMLSSKIACQVQEYRHHIHVTVVSSVVIMKSHVDTRF